MEGRGIGDRRLEDREDQFCNSLYLRDPNRLIIPLPIPGTPIYWLTSDRFLMGHPRRDLGTIDAVLSQRGLCTGNETHVPQDAR